MSRSSNPFPALENAARADMERAARLATPLAVAHKRQRGSYSNASGRFEVHSRDTFDDGWGEEDLPPFRTQTLPERAVTILTRNTSPDIPFDRSINPYRGCEHGCSYCYARPTHAYLGLSPGLDFESKLYAKLNAAELLERELSKPGYVPREIALGANTDPYQPIERTYTLTRQILEVLARVKHPVTIVTKGALVLRDLDLLAPMAAEGLAKVAISVTTLDGKLARAMEPRASIPAKRLEALRQLQAAGVPTAVMVAPIIPAINEHEIERILEAAAEVGVREAHYVLLRLPLELREIFREWLIQHYPGKLRHVMSLIQSSRGGKDNESAFGQRMNGTGSFADMIAKRFRLARERCGMKERANGKLRCDLFKPPVLAGGQLSLF